MNRSDHRARPSARLGVEELESRLVPDATAVLAGGVLAVNLTGPNLNRVDVSLDAVTQQLVVKSDGLEVFRQASAAVAAINITGSPGKDVVRIADNVLQPATVQTFGGNDLLVGGGGTTTLNGGFGNDKLYAGPGSTALVGGPNPADVAAMMLTGTDNDLLVAGPSPDLVNGGIGINVIRNLGASDIYNEQAGDVLTSADPQTARQLAMAMQPQQTITADEVGTLLRRASAASASNDFIIAIVDRNGRILGVRAEDNVAPLLLGQALPADLNTLTAAQRGLLTFAVDGAVSLARTGAFFANNQAPLTSRTVRNLSQTTLTQREVDSNPDVLDPNSTAYGPGFVGPIGIGGHFPPGIAFTPQVDLFAIEHTNRDGTVHPGRDSIRGTGDEGEGVLPERFNTNPLFTNGTLFAPDSYGFTSGIFVNGQSRGVGTLPGGIPIYKNGQLVGGIGVFYAGKTGFASESNPTEASNHDPNKPDRTIEAEYIAFAAVGGAPGIGFGIPAIQGVGLPSGFNGLPLTQQNQRIDLIGLTLDIVGPGGTAGPELLAKFGFALPQGNPDAGTNLAVNPNGATLDSGLAVADGFIVTPHDGVGVTAAEATRIILTGIQQEQRTRAAIRLPLNSSAKQVYAVSDLNGEIIALYRTPDATVFSIDVAVAKARNAAYYANATLLQAADTVANVPPGTALTARTFRFLALPNDPEGIDPAPPAPFSQLNDDPFGTSQLTGLQVGPRLPAAAYKSVLGHDSFFPQTNFRDPRNPRNQNGVVFFPGSSALYRDATGDGLGMLIGGLGVSGDGVDQDDVITFAAGLGFEPPPRVGRADQFFVLGARLPYQLFNRQPLIAIR